MLSVAFTGAALLYISAVYSTTYGASLTCIIGAAGLSGVSAAGFLPNHLDIAPQVKFPQAHGFKTLTSTSSVFVQYASILMGLSGTIATAPGIASPIVTGVIVKTGVRI